MAHNATRKEAPLPAEGDAGLASREARGKSLREVWLLRVSYTTLAFREGDAHVAYAPQLGVSSCGDSAEEAERMLREAAGLFLEEAHRMGTLEDILAEAGYSSVGAGEFRAPKLAATSEASIEVAG